MKITRIFTFDSAHILPYHAGKCSNLHGHTYKLEVTVQGRVQPPVTFPTNVTPHAQTGMVWDFGRLNEIVTRHIIDVLDHRNINTTIENPTAENMLLWIRGVLAPIIEDMIKGVRLYSLRLWETPNSYATWDVTDETN